VQPSERPSTIYKCGANAAAIRDVNEHACVDIEAHQAKYLNSIVYRTIESLDKSKIRCWAASYFAVAARNVLLEN